MRKRLCLWEKKKTSPDSGEVIYTRGSDCSTRLEVGGFQERRIDSVRLLFSSRENHWPFASGTFRKLSRTGICFSGPCIRC